MNKLPLVSVIIPTTSDREEYNRSIINQFLKQDYPNKEILIDDKEGTVGEKRNRLCEQAKGEIILHMDSDDWYKPTWISESVYALTESGCNLTGLSSLRFYNKEKDEVWRYRYSIGRRPKWVAGATMCYLKSLWEKNKFRETNDGEDNDFAYGWGGVIPTICARQHISSFLASIHSGNTSSKKTEYEADVMQNGSIVKAKLKIINWRMCVGEEKEAIKTYWNL